MGFVNYVKNIQPVRPDAEAVLTLGTGGNAPTLDKLQFMLSGTDFTVAHILGIKGFLNGKEFYIEESGTVHNARRAYMGLPVANNELVLDFTEPNARSAIEQYLTGIPLSLVQDCRFELMLSAACVAPKLVARAHVRAPTQNPYVKKFRKLNQPFSAGGDQDIYLPSGANGGKVARIWVHEGVPGNITYAELKARNTTAWQGTRDEIQKSQAHNGLTPQAGVLVLDFIEDGNLGNWVDTARLAEPMLSFKATNPDAYKVFIEYIDPIAGL